jgi:putative membrane protein
MKTIIRNIVIYTFALYLLPSVIPGVQIDGGLLTLFIGGVALALMFLILKPILNIISFPVNMMTLGLFSMFTNALILYLLTIFVTNISILPFAYHKTTIAGFGIPTIYFNTFFAYVYTAFVLSLIDSFITWLMD